MSDSILESFKVESLQLVKELNSVVEKIESARGTFPAELMKEFSQKIDRIMGTAQVIGELHPKHEGLRRISAIAQLCKSIGYKAAEQKDAALMPIFAAFWADTLEVTESLLNALENEKATVKISREFSVVLQSRLEWLSKKVSPKEAEKKFNIEELLKQFGV